jgi:hypothetical protein
VGGQQPVKEFEMGWTVFSGLSQDDLIEKLIASKTYLSEGQTLRRETLAHRLVHEQGVQVLWAVQRVSKNAIPQETYIACFLIEGSGYKDLAESMYPYYFSCPPEYLHMAPEVCPEWRQKVRRCYAIGQEEALS